MGKGKKKTRTEWKKVDLATATGFHTGDNDFLYQFDNPDLEPLVAAAAKRSPLFDEFPALKPMLEQFAADELGYYIDDFGFVCQSAEQKQVTLSGLAEYILLHPPKDPQQAAHLEGFATDPARLAEVVRQTDFLVVAERQRDDSLEKELWVRVLSHSGRPRYDSN